MSSSTLLPLSFSLAGRLERFQRRHDRDTPDAETVEQALAYRKALARRPDWNHSIVATVVEVCGSAGYNWFDL